MEIMTDMILFCIYIMDNYNFMLLHTITSLFFAGLCYHSSQRNKRKGTSPFGDLDLKNLT